VSSRWSLNSEAPKIWRADESGGHGVATLARGPCALTRRQRLDVAREVAEALCDRYGDHIDLVALFGSTARGDDAAYSDIELLCVVSGQHHEFKRHLIWHGSKIEIELCRKRNAYLQAGIVTEWWPLTHEKFRSLRRIYGDRGLCARLRNLPTTAPIEACRAVAKRIIISRVYEGIGKVRNAVKSRRYSSLPLLTFKIAESVALMLALYYRKPYSNTVRMFSESLSFGDYPAGYGAICEVIMLGPWRNVHTLAPMLEELWSGVVQWATAKGLE